MHKEVERRLRFVLVAAGCLAAGGCQSKPVAKGPIPPGEYVVLEGDDLSSIALRAYGDMNLWASLLNANRQLTTRPRFRLEVGESITIPAKADLDNSLPKSVFPKQLPADYVIMPGDSLFFIAKSCYGERDLWPHVFEANRTILSQQVKDNPFLLTAGEVLHIPAAPNEEQAAEARKQASAARQRVLQRQGLPSANKAIATGTGH